MNCISLYSSRSSCVGFDRYVNCSEQGITHGECKDLAICVAEDSGFEKLLVQLFPSNRIHSRASLKDLFRSFVSGDDACNVIADDVMEISPDALQKEGYNGEYTLGVNRYSVEPRAIATRQTASDLQFTKLVSWLVTALIYAEENGVTKDTADDMPLIRVFGNDFQDVFVRAVEQVGSFSEVYKRNLREGYPRGGPNLINTHFEDPQLNPYLERK